MKRPKLSQLPQHDYALALQSAVSWMGDRYLLAEPVKKRAEEYRPYYLETKSWHEPQRAAGLGRKH